MPQHKHQALALNLSGEKIARKTGVHFKAHGGLYVMRKDQVGNVDVEVDCSYCGTTNTTRLWSLCGVGKRCSGCYCLIGEHVCARPLLRHLSALTKRDHRRKLWARALVSRNPAIIFAEMMTECGLKPNKKLLTRLRDFCDLLVDVKTEDALVAQGMAAR
jgi:hypothetical protein